MCLKQITKTKLDKTEKTGTGYKVFKRNKQGRLTPSIFNEENKFLPIEKWLDEKKYRCRGYQTQTYITSEDYLKRHYLAGWHIFLNKKDAQYWKTDTLRTEVIRKVKYRKAHTLGNQSRYNSGTPNCVVAKEIKILRGKTK